MDSASARKTALTLTLLASLALASASPADESLLKRTTAGFQGVENQFNLLFRNPSANDRCRLDTSSYQQKHDAAIALVRSAYAKLVALCAQSGCVARDPACGEPGVCEQEAKRIAMTYVNVVNAAKKPYRHIDLTTEYTDEKGNGGDIVAGYKCHEWAGLIERSVSRLQTRCWKANWAGIIKKGVLEHNFAIVSMGEVRPDKVKGGVTQPPARTCSLDLDPWSKAAVQPVVLDPESGEWERWNYIGPSANLFLRTEYPKIDNTSVGFVYNDEKKSWFIGGSADIPPTPRRLPDHPSWYVPLPQISDFTP